MAYDDGMGIRSPLRYIGSKRRLAARITAVMDSHTCYVEPFGGSAAVLLAKAKSPVEVYNDYDGALVNFFRVCRSDSARLMEFLRYTMYSRKEFDYYKALDIRTIEDPLEAAAAYFFMNRTSFGSLQIKPTFGFGAVASPSGAYDSSIGFIPHFAERMRSVTIEQRHWSKIIEMYDRPDTLFYIDPPYWGAEQHYVAQMAREEHEQLADVLSKIKGKAMVSYYAGPEVEALYGPAGLDWHRRNYTITKAIGKENAMDKEGGTAKYPVAHEVLYSSRKRSFSFDSLWGGEDDEVIVGDESEDFSFDDIPDPEPSLF
jgi:DNA adenine methylase